MNRSRILLFRFAVLGILAAATSRMLGQAPSLSFEGVLLPNRFTAAVSDANSDRWFEPFGSVNTGAGVLFIPGSSYDAYLTSIGLIDFAAAAQRANRDIRIADFNGDGLSDIVANTYACIQNPSIGLLFFRQMDGTYIQSYSFSQLALKGHGETILVADFNNDGALDIYFPFYSFQPSYGPPPPSTCQGSDFGNTAFSSVLLANDGHGVFSNVTQTSGAGLVDQPPELRVEGGQAADVNNDGLIDFYVGNHLFMNNGNFTFTDFNDGLGAGCTPKLPRLFDEGMRFLDWNNDGYLDILLDHTADTLPHGLRLFQFNGTCFTEAAVFPAMNGMVHQVYGVNAYDLDNDGDEDVVLEGSVLSTEPTNKVFRNNVTSFEQSFTEVTVAGFNGLRGGQGSATFADINRDGRIDILYPEVNPSNSMWYFRNTSTLAAGAGSFTVELLGPNGERNQYGRVIEVIRPSGGKFVRVVDGGSGQLSQGQYPLLVGTLESGAHTVKARFAPESPGGPVRIVQFSIKPGQYGRVFAPSATNPGRVVIGDGWLQPLLKRR